MNEQMIQKIKKYTIIVMVVVCLYFFLARPYIQFKKDENTMLNAVKRYCEVNENTMATGRRVSTITLDTLFKEKYLDKDFHIPFSKKVCSPTKSWAKVTKVDSERKYYIYLDCGILKSNVDHEGPVIKLNGDTEMTISRYSKFKDPGIESVIDKKDGQMKIEDVTVKGKVNPDKVGTYKIEYTALDSLNNKTTIKREINVIERLKDTVKRQTKTGYYVGTDPKNYIYFANNLFRIIGVDGNNVKITSNLPIGNVNYQGLDQYLTDYYEKLPEESRDLVVKNKYCNMQVNENTITSKECSSYTKERELYVPSIDEINRARIDGESFFDKGTTNWTANKADDKTAFATLSRLVLSDTNNYMKRSYNDIFAISPVITIRGDIEIEEGNGSFDDPYEIYEVDIGEPGDALNTRIIGEYVSIGDYLYRIVGPQKDGTTKVIIEEMITDEDGMPILASNLGNNDANYEYNPKVKGSIGYYINNKISKYVSSKLFENHEIEVPYYRKNVIYGREIEKKKYKAKFIAPDAFDLFNVGNNEFQIDYWLLNSTKEAYLAYLMNDTGNVFANNEYRNKEEHSIRVCAYVKKNATIVRGEGTEYNPYTISD